MKEQFGWFLETDTLHMKNLLLLGRRTLMEQRLSTILCLVFKVVNNKTNPESLNELISLRETIYALRGKEVLEVLRGTRIWNNLPDVVTASSEHSKNSQKMSHYFSIDESPF